MFSSMATITSEAWTNQCPKNVNTYLHTYLVSFKTLIGSLFPLFPLCWWSFYLAKTWTTKIGEIGEIGTLSGWSAKTMVLRVHPGQNHERAPISPISPILVVYVFSSCQDMDHQNRGNRDPLMVLALHPGKTLRGSLFPLLPLRDHQNEGC